MPMIKANKDKDMEHDEYKDKSMESPLEEQVGLQILV